MLNKVIVPAAFFTIFASSFSSTCPAETLSVNVTGQALSINGQTEIPRGLFGVHAMKVSDEDAERWGIEAVRLIHPLGTKTPSVPGGSGGQSSKLSSVVDGMFDRYVPALQLTDPEWEKHLTQLAQEYGNAARKTGKNHYVEFWNEAYLNWAAKPGVNYAAPLYRTNNIKSGDPMVLKITGKEVPGLVWDREIFFVKEEDETLNYVLSGYIPRTTVEGEPTMLGYGAGQAVLKNGGTVRLRGKEYRVVKDWSGRDPEQKYYWSGPVNERLYNEMLAVYGKCLKETNPDVLLAAGWGFNFYNENWESWKRLIQPTIDKNHEWIDALHEHHYGGDTRLVAASYEVAYAYTLARYERRLRFWNTEAGGHLDPQQPGNALSGNQGTPSTKAIAAMTYLLRDISYLLDRMPDKVIHRAAHEPQNNGGDLPALQFLKPLRGKLLHVETGMPMVWSIAAVEGRRLTVLLFNDASEARPIPLSVQAPAGTTFVGMKESRLVTEFAPPWLKLEEQQSPANGDSWTGTPALSGKSALVLLFELSSEPVFKESLVKTQYASGDVLLPLTNGAETIIPVPINALQQGFGTLRLTLSNPGSGYSVLLNGQKLDTRDPDSQIWDIPIGKTGLKEKNQIHVNSPDGKGMLLAASIYVETVLPEK